VPQARGDSGFGLIVCRADAMTNSGVTQWLSIGRAMVACRRPRRPVTIKTPHLPTWARFTNRIGTDARRSPKVRHPALPDGGLRAELAGLRCSASSTSARCPCSGLLGGVTEARR
jgi:hypothetical protein